MIFHAIIKSLNHNHSIFTIVEKIFFIFEIFQFLVNIDCDCVNQDCVDTKDITDESTETGNKILVSTIESTIITERLLM